MLFCQKATNHACRKRPQSVQSAALRPVCCWVTWMRLTALRHPRALSWVLASKSLIPEVVRESYVARLVELRKNKGMTEAVAREQLEDNVVLGTLMLEQDRS